MAIPSRILQAARLQGAYDNLIDYYKDPERQNTRINTKEAHPPQKDVAISPFEGGLNHANQKVAARTTEEAWTSYQTILAGYAVETPVEDPFTMVKLGNFKPAKIIIKTLTGQKSVGVSARTKLKYLKYEGTSRGFAYGRKVVTDTELETYAELKKAFLAPLSNEQARTFRFSRQKEQI